MTETEPDDRAARAAHIRNLVIQAIMIDMESEGFTNRIFDSLENHADADAVVNQEGGWHALAETVNGVLDEVFRAVSAMRTTVRPSE